MNLKGMSEVMAQLSAKLANFVIAAAITAKEALRLSFEGWRPLGKGESLTILAGGFLARTILTEGGAEATDNNGDPIRILYAVGVRRNERGWQSPEIVSLRKLAGRELLAEPEARVLKSTKSGNYYVATWQSEKTLTSLQGLTLAGGQTGFAEDFTIVSDGKIEGFKAPEFNEVFTSVNSGWANNPEFLDRIKWSDKDHKEGTIALKKASGEAFRVVKTQKVPAATREAAAAMVKRLCGGAEEA